MRRFIARELAVAGAVCLAAGLGAGCRLGFEAGRADAGGAGDGAPADVGPDGSGLAYAATVLADGPALYLRFDEAGGPTATSLVGGYAGTYEGAFGFGAVGAVNDGNTAVTFDGRTTRLPLGDVLRFGGSAPYTIEVWLRPTDIADTRFVVDRRDVAESGGYTLYLGGDYLLHARVAGGQETGYVNAGAGVAPAPGAWTYVVATYDGAATRMYVNGVQTGVNGGNGATPIADVAATLVIGDLAPGQFNKYEGDLDELAIYDAALSAAQVAAHYRAAGY